MSKVVEYYNLLNLEFFLSFDEVRWRFHIIWTVSGVYLVHGQSQGVEYIVDLLPVLW